MSYRAFTNELKSEIKKVYLLYGQESYLLDNAKELLKKKVVTAFPELNYNVLEGEAITVEQLQNACDTFPFGSEKKLVVVRQPAFLTKANKKGEEEETDEDSNEEEGEPKAPKDSGELKGYLDLLKELPDSCCLLLLYYGNLGKAKKVKDAVAKDGSEYEFKRIDKDDLSRWVINSFSRYNKKIGFKEMDYFIALSDYLDKNSEKNLYNLENEIDKISAFSGKVEDITIKHIDAVMAKSLENDIFKLINSSADKRISDSLSVLSDLLTQGEEIFAILAMITKQIRTMTSVVELNQKGLDAKAAASKLKIHEFYAKNCLNYGKKIGMQGLIKGLNNCVSIELNVKSGKMDKRLGMEMLIINMFK
ncbi:MAG: polymerase delta subunit [Clostridia bacterium]|jgi:DNA polymerase-3 subunit delta|nr:polymerase delta subunit [Clostridia bacterium]